MNTDEIKARCEAGRPIPRIDVKWLLSEVAQLTARAEKAEKERDEYRAALINWHEPEQKECGPQKEE